MNLYKKIGIATLIGLIGLTSCQKEPQGQHYNIQLAYSGNIDLIEKAVVISRSEFQDLPIGDFFPIILTEMNDTVPAQFDDSNGDGSWDELFFLINLKSGEGRNLKLLLAENKQDFEKRVNIRFGVRESENDIVKPATSHTFYPHQLPGVMGYQPYQTDGPSWENDCVGFRHYLDGRNSKDVFGKKVKYMSPDDVGINEEGVTEDNYHVMEDWGRDILAVGNSVGIGGFGLKIGDRLARLGVTEQDSLNNVSETDYTILANGSIRGLMRFDYHDWKPQEFDRIYQVKEYTSIWAGVQGYQNTVSISGLQGDEELVIGLVNSRTDKPLTSMEVGNFQILYTHDLQTYEKDWYLGLALIVPKENFLGFSEAPKEGSLSNSYLARMKIDEGKQISYYAVAAWELSDERFREEAYFRDYLKTLAENIDYSIDIHISKQ
ncbi:DUF4861 domain-containing protein [Belliella aquatica]|uniref:DUF4861 domain-containing protein n=1 Tax=Belliella aquatica TaxID=1323734 RepID=A0ABQ1M1L8_9BACT|nr:DUF4861 domain-containing protein [Belliella aquatica]MCH7406892.1 DUF4861 domain-containing protein [Belliella aquatica]GGC31917.1 hypothetical protein GCM10010993_08600 [Belliella aquatica]